MLKKNLNDYNNVFAEMAEKTPILTAGNKTIGFNSMIVGWGGLGFLWGKNVCFVFVRKSRYTHEFLENSDSVCLSFLNEDLRRKTISIFGDQSGKDIDKLKTSGLHNTFDPDMNCAYICECDYVLKMKKLYSVDINYDDLPNDVKQRYYSDRDMHTMYVCEIKQYLEKEKKGE